ncbi:hypothetical protein CARUB_v10025294mg [Capsella rubella]|uniref:Ubiquitin-like protease family profile domain-containing protein n=1 Tax=Capsella rubella TaxID=81985 RepID=R0HHB1_9BRAS|nr:hypothetical protein CARUB_v10025294mg [Capsella rubella]
MDATMYLFREKASLGQLQLARVGFMSCIFGMQLQNEYQKFLNNKRNYKWSSFIEAYANGELPSHAIPRIVKEIHTKSDGKSPLLSPYTLVHVSVPPGLNKSKSDCGVYALKYIECHFLGLPIDMVHDDNIRHAHYKIAVDLWEAATDPVFIDRMAKYEPPQLDSDMVAID